MSTSLELSPEQQLAAFRARYEPAIDTLLRELHVSLRALLPGAVELVYDNYNALVIGFGPSEHASEAIVSLAAMPRWVNLCFLRGVDLPDPHHLLAGDGSQVRTVRLHSAAQLDSPAVLELVRAAARRAHPPIDHAAPNRLVIRSISPKQRPRRPRS